MCLHYQSAVAAAEDESKSANAGSFCEAGLLQPISAAKASQTANFAACAQSFTSVRSKTLAAEEGKRYDERQLLAEKGRRASGRLTSFPDPDILQMSCPAHP
jgi:hypothetical protein